MILFLLKAIPTAAAVPGQTTAAQSPSGGGSDDQSAKVQSNAQSAPSVAMRGLSQEQKVAQSNLRRKDITSLRRQPPTKEELRKKIRDAAVLYEKHFLREMWKSMRATAQGDSAILPQGPGQKLYQEQLDDQYIDQWSAQGGVGYADIIYNQLIERYGSQMGL